jgi:hypothetical protein
VAVPPGRRISRTQSVDNPLASHIRAEQAKDDLKWQDFLRSETKKLLGVFYVLNGAVFLLVVVLWCGETFHAVQNQHPPIITERVILALIAASAAQLGGLAVAAAMAVIKRRSSNTTGSS